MKERSFGVVHQYKNNGYNIVLDVNSGSVHVVDELVYDAIALLNEGKTQEEAAQELKRTYQEAEITEALEECSQLTEAGVLFSEDIYENAIIDYKARKTVVKALCLHIAHDCNLACRYCFAEEGEYHGRRALMSYEVGKKALDFLIANSGARRNLEVDFFGGEPLMNWQVVKDLVKYGREQEKLHDKKFRFTLTTNGVLLNDEIMEFCNKEMANVVLSIDGRKEVHDFMRPFRKGAGSYDLVMPKFKKFAETSRSITSEARLPITTSIFRTTCCIWQKKVLSRYRWSLSWRRNRKSMRSGKKISPGFWKSMISLLPRW